MFRPLFRDHLQGSSFVLCAFTTFQLPASSFVFFGYVAVCLLFLCVPGVPVCVLSGRETTQTRALSIQKITASSQARF
jgi:hypothetical protein